VRRVDIYYFDKRLCRLLTTKLRGWRFGVFEADLETHELRKHGVHIKLAGQPFQALSILLHHPGEVVAREDLRHALWPHEPWGDHDQRLNKAINKVRDALNDSADSPRLIETIPRVGYRFLGSVVPLNDFVGERDVPGVEPVAQTPPEIPCVPEPAAVPPRRWSPSRWIIGCGLLAAVGAAVFLYRDAIPDHALSRNTAAQLTGSQAKPLTTYVGSEQYPSFSPDGKQVAFAWDGPALSGLHIYVISANGRNLRQLTRGPFSDYGPIWSPDGSTLAFMRESAAHSKELWISNADGSTSRKVADFGPIARSEHPLAWTKNPHWLIAAARPVGEGPPALHLIATDNGERRRLTSPPMQSAGDLSPSISPDGKRVAFTRGTNIARREIFIVAISEDLSPLGDPVRVTDMQKIIDTVAWSADGRELYFSASPTPSGIRHIFRVDAGKTSHNVVETGIEGLHPVISPDGQLLCYVRNNIEQTSIWRMDLPDGRPGSKTGAEPKRFRLLSSTRRDYTADLSPDGKQMVFSSVRSGPSEIWISNIDGSNLRQITFKSASTPRWSPDGRWIVYESSAAGQPDIYVFDLRKDTERRLTSYPDAHLRPSWSRDSKFVYFSSTRTGRSQLWKVSVDGGPERQITRDGGTYGVEAFDGNTVYYTSAGQPPSIRSVPANGGPEVTLVENVVGYSAISLGRGGLCYLASISFTGAEMGFYSFADHAARPLVAIDRPVHHFLSGSPDGKSVLFTQVDRQDSDLMLLPIGSDRKAGEPAAK
jgi:Tol biopolymer transport system component/DNA-binding winged helix-turn-helix (wHTH) protein